MQPKVLTIDCELDPLPGNPPTFTSGLAFGTVRLEAEVLKPSKHAIVVQAITEARATGGCLRKGLHPVESDADW
jgi:hypothetical protein